MKGLGELDPISKAPNSRTESSHQGSSLHAKASNEKHSVALLGIGTHYASKSITSSSTQPSASEEGPNTIESVLEKSKKRTDDVDKDLYYGNLVVTIP